MLLQAAVWMFGLINETFDLGKTIPAASTLVRLRIVSLGIDLYPSACSSSLSTGAGSADQQQIRDS